MAILLLKLSLLLIFGVWVRRIFWAHSLAQSNPPLEPFFFDAQDNPPKVSVIVPAKNEEKNIARCLKSLFGQRYPHFEIIVVDDRSTDRTPHLLENFSKLSPVPFKIIRIEKLPPGWTGKNHGQWAASKVATGDFLLFTDADTEHRKASIATTVKTALDRNIDFLTLAPETECKSFWENVVQPLAVSSIALWFPHEELANGQYLLIKKEAYETVGGNEAIKSEVVEDVELARLMRKFAFQVQFLNGTRLYSTRMYTSLSQIKTGWTRIFTHLFRKRVGPILHKIFLFMFFSLLPFVALAWQIYAYFWKPSYWDSPAFFLSGLVSAWIVLIRAVGNKMVKSNIIFALFHPLGSLVMIWILLCCIGRILFNRPSIWRGDLH